MEYIFVQTQWESTYDSLSISLQEQQILYITKLFEELLHSKHSISLWKHRQQLPGHNIREDGLLCNNLNLKMTFEIKKKKKSQYLFLNLVYNSVS